tara:strand:+ start:10931 stop:13063 length:2133 start_codon:yes stop_codon:yes gene_type:complete
MKTPGKLTINPQEGLFIGIPAPYQTANRLTNFRYDPKTKAWCTNLGYEKYFSNQTNLGPFAGAEQREVDSVYCFQQHSGARQSVLFETNGRLQIINGSSEGIDLLQSGRKTPTATEPHTSYEPYGRYVIITNGLDGPIKYRGTGGGSPRGDRLFDLGWRQLPGTPTVRGVGRPDEVPKTFLDASDSIVNDQIWKANDSSFRGVTSGTAAEESRYSYKVSFVNEAGSESPLSQSSNEITYTSVSVTRGGTSGVPKTGFIIDIPRGPNGTLARRIYRTKNGTSQYFFLKQLNENGTDTITDFFTDTQLGAEAPGITDSVLMPSPSCRFTATFKNCLFIDGGEADPTRLFFSTPLQPDTYKAQNFFEVGTREGGDITGLAPYYNSLVVFRENAIDLVRGNPVAGFELIPFIQGVGTLSPQTIVPIPNFGLSFLSQDGCYVLKGGLDGGANLSLEKISGPIQEFFDRASRDKLPAAVGAYSQKERELHYYFTMDGQTFLNKGICYHVDSGNWSERSGFPVKCITTDKDGNFICGYDENNVYTGFSSPRATGNPARGGLFVISGIHKEGYKFGVVPNIVEGNDVLSSFRSAWHDFGFAANKKHVKYVYLLALTTGDATLDVTIFKDREWANGVLCPTVLMQRADHKDQPVYDDDLYRWDKVDWQDKLLTQIRVDVANMACSEFAFQFDTIDQIEFIGYQVEYTLDETKTIGGKRK